MILRVVFRFMAVLALFAAVTWLLRRVGLLRPAGAGPKRGYRFSLEFRDGRRTQVEGVVPRSVYNAFEDVASLTRMSGRVRARPDGLLEFSDEVPDGVRQQFRNAWWASAENRVR